MNPAGDSTPGTGGWASAWPDALAFIGGLALAWFNHWETKDLVWSLWLSSLLVGYALIVWNIFGAGILAATQAGGAPAAARNEPRGPQVAGGVVYAVGGLFLLAFFTVHFGLFHLVHSVFLNSFFPLAPGRMGWPGLALYGEVLRDYWPFVLIAALAERQAFRRPGRARAAWSSTAVTPEAIAARQGGASAGMMAPYRNVVRLHLLIFFFAFAHFAKLDNFLVYAVVYAVYFFPWRLLKRG